VRTEAIVRGRRLEPLTAWPNAGARGLDASAEAPGEVTPKR
jgi:hypothetical protein